MAIKEFEKRVYTPRLSGQSSAAIRRFAFSKGIRMTKALEMLINALPVITDPTKVCLSCQDKTDCTGCIFCRHFTAEDKKAVLSAL
jgi:recombinational DNA repair protein RecR